MVLEIKNQFLYLKQHEDIFSIVSDLFVLTDELFALVECSITVSHNRCIIYMFFLEADNNHSILQDQLFVLVFVELS